MGRFLECVRASALDVTAVSKVDASFQSAHHGGEIVPWCGETGLFITPGFRFRAVDLLMTNFHLPRSTLFMLVSAFAGLARMQALYAHAMARDFRFYSYGDACLLERCEGAS